MPRSIYITSAEGHTGKSMIALGVLDAFLREGRNVGVFRPVSRSRTQPDDVLDLLLRHIPHADEAPDCVGVTYEDVHADPDGSISHIIAHYKDIEPRHDVMVILGSDYTDISSPAELAYNARIAANLAAPVLLVLGGRTQDEDSPANSQFITGDPRTADEMAQLAEMAIAELSAEHAQLAAVIANRVDREAMQDVKAALAQAVDDVGRVPVWTLPEDPVLVAPTLRDLMRNLDGELENGTYEQLDNDVLSYVVSGMSMENVLVHLEEGAAVVVPGDRSEVLLAVQMAHNSETFPKLAGIIMNGGFEMSPPIKRLIQGMTTDLPIVKVPYGTFETARRITRTRGRLATAPERKIDLALEHFRSNVDGAALREIIETGQTRIITPLMFEYQITERARSDRKHVVLPEGNDDRILLAAAHVLARGAAEITILGDAAEISAAAQRLGIDLSDAHVISPDDPELNEKFAGEYTRLRAHKGMTVERARDIVRDVSYFGTMMVQFGMADGMVSGAAHTTAHTIKPSFEIIKTQPDVSIVSSVFFMSLPDRVLVYGDCAVNPNPTAEQLADIAISSARSAEQFGIEPRVAMLSYSTGESGAGDDVDKVREATRLVRERHPDLLVEGPIQYDAASDAAVGASKMPGSPVAGHATVFIFPDLNTGNNTYKAVQRSAGAVAIGPMLQGLRKPINDLSRGALVKDIVNTIAITVIQAQGVGKVNNVLVVNSGSSSIKYQIIDMDTEELVAKGLIERIGTDHGVVNHTDPQVEKHTFERPVLDHIAGFRAMIEACDTYGPRLEETGITAVGHRVVQGGSRFIEPTVIDDAVIRTVEELSPLAPLHNPPNLLGIHAARQTFPNVPHVAIFDTAFHQTMPPEAYTYAIDANIAAQYRIRRYGFHGTSHKYVSELAAEYLQLPPEDVNTIVLHIGNGVSVTAIEGGRSVETSMGMTPLEGLVMGTRSGDIDPGVLFHLRRQAGMTIQQLDDLLNRRSGLLGMTGSSDMRDVMDSARRGEPRAELALATYCHRLKGYVGAYYAQLGRADAIVFTAGVGENAPEVRERTLSGLEHLGIRLDPEANNDTGGGIREISAPESEVTVLVIPTNEELEIARQTVRAIA